MCYKRELTIFRTNFTASITLENLPMLTKHTGHLPTNIALVRSSGQNDRTPINVARFMGHVCQPKVVLRIVMRIEKVTRKSSKVFSPLEIFKISFEETLEPLWKYTELHSVLFLNSLNPLRPVGIANKLLAVSIIPVSFLERPICCICEQCTLHRYIFLCFFSNLSQHSLWTLEALWPLSGRNRKSRNLFPKYYFLIRFNLFHTLLLGSSLVKSEDCI